MDGGLIDGHVTEPHGLQSLTHGVLRPWGRIGSGQFDTFTFAPAVESASGDAKLRGGLLDGRLTGSDRFQSFFEVFGRPRGRCGVEWGRQSYSFSSRYFV